MNHVKIIFKTDIGRFSSFHAHAKHQLISLSLNAHTTKKKNFCNCRINIFSAKICNNYVKNMEINICNTQYIYYVHPILNRQTHISHDITISFEFHSHWKAHTKCKRAHGTNTWFYNELLDILKSITIIRVEHTMSKYKYIYIYILWLHTFLWLFAMDLIYVYTVHTVKTNKKREKKRNNKKYNANEHAFAFNIYPKLTVYFFLHSFTLWF